MVRIDRANHRLSSVTPTSARARRKGHSSTTCGDSVARFFLRRGYLLDQTHSNFQLDLPDGRQSEVGQEHLVPASYELEVWDGGTPENHVAAMAALRTLMSTAAPAGSVEPEEQRWDADRVHRYDQERTRLGLALHTVATPDRGSGQLVAYTELTVNPRTPALLCRATPSSRRPTAARGSGRP
jgi:hypothetical protein